MGPGAVSQQQTAAASVASIVLDTRRSAWKQIRLCRREFRVLCGDVKAYCVPFLRSLGPVASLGKLP